MVGGGGESFAELIQNDSLIRERMLSRSCRQHDLRSGTQIPDNPASKYEANRDELRATQYAAENRAAAGIISKELEQEPRDTVEKKICTEDLAIELLAGEHPGEQKKDSQFHRGLKQLSRFESLAERRTDNFMGQGIGEGHTPEVGRWFSIAAASGKTAEASDGMAHSKPGSKRVASGEGGHVVSAQEPPGCDEGCDQAARKNSASLQGIEAEDFAKILPVNVS